jgi:pimeloyl-ACP methyl ester carboxylesterase
VDLAYADVQPLTATAVTSSGPAASAADAPVLVLLHGFTNDADAWAATVELLRELLPDHRFVIPDLRGHGESSLPADGRWRDDPDSAFTMGALAADVVALMDALGIATATVAGHSMGSLVAQVLAADHPRRVSSMVLVSTTGDARGTPFLSDWLRDDVIAHQWRPAIEAQGVVWPDEAMALTPLDADPEAVAWMVKLWNFYPLTPGRSTLELAERAARLPFATWVGALEGILSTHRLGGLRTRSTPACVLWATQDSFFRRGSQEALIAALRAVGDSEAGGVPFVWKQYGRLPLPADGIQADDLGHNLTWDAPAVVAADLAAFVTTGMPTSTWFRSDAPADPYRIVGEPDAAVMVTSG